MLVEWSLFDPQETVAFPRTGRSNMQKQTVGGSKRHWAGTAPDRSVKPHEKQTFNTGPCMWLGKPLRYISTARNAAASDWVNLRRYFFSTFQRKITGATIAPERFERYAVGMKNCAVGI